MALFQQPILVVLGPTGSGKSELALALASYFGGEIINCDSIQVYRGLDIGSAKTPIENRRNIPHHLLDVIGPGEELSAGSYARIGRQRITEIHQRGHLPIVVGGTGFYLRALLEGLSPAPERDARLRERLQQIEAQRHGFLHRVLRRFDAQAALRIHENDTSKLIRAIEIMFLSGQPATTAQSAPRDAFNGIATLKLGLAPNRQMLYARLNERAEWLFHNGLIPETKKLMDMGYSYDSKPMQSLGYKQAVKFIRRELDFQQAIAECQVKTRQYAKRQMTWYRVERDVNWLNGFGSERALQDRAIQLSSSFLSTLHSFTFAR